MNPVLRELGEIFFYLSLKTYYFVSSPISRALVVILAFFNTINRFLLVGFTVIDDRDVTLIEHGVELDSFSIYCNANFILLTTAFYYNFFCIIPGE